MSTDRKLGERSITEAELEALAHGRRDLASDDARRAVEEDDALGAWLEREHDASHDASVALKRAAPELDDLDSMIALAMAKAPERAAPVDAPSRASLWIGASLGAAIALASGIASIVSSDPGSIAHEVWSDASALARLGVTLTMTLDRLVALVPGGWGSIALAGLALFTIVALPLRALTGPLRLRATSSAMVLALAITGASGTAHAYELEGTWPEPDAQVSVDVDRTPLSEALQRALASSELGLAYTLPDDPLVTLHVREAPLREVIDALLGDVPARVRHTGHLVSIRPPAVDAADDRAENPASEIHDAPSVAALPTAPASPALAVAAAPPAPPVPPVPPVHTSPPPGRELRDVVTFGGDARVPAGQQVRDVITMGGDARIDGQAFGNVVTMGGDAEVHGSVVGDVVTMGGDIDVARGGQVHGQLNAMGGSVVVQEPHVQHGASALAVASHARQEHADRDDDGGGWVAETLDAAMRHALLFLLGLLFMGLAPARLQMLQGTMAKLPLRALASGFLGVVAGAVLTIVLVITILGIPAALVLILALFLGGYLGLATAASVIGGVLPLPALKDRPVLQLGVGVLILFVVSRVPVIGGLLIAGATLIGLGAVIMTRFGQKPITGIGSET